MEILIFTIGPSFLIFSLLILCFIEEKLKIKSKIKDKIQDEKEIDKDYEEALKELNELYPGIE
jgi:hypothetical protein